MSSSLLLVLIVVVWLFVLAPLVVNTREPIRRTSEGLGRTRLLHRGGESVPTRRRRPALSERDIRRGDDDADESLETVDAEYANFDDEDSILIDDTGRAPADETPPAVVEGDVVYELEAGAAESGEVDQDGELIGDADPTGERSDEVPAIAAEGIDGDVVAGGAADVSGDTDGSGVSADAARGEDARAYLTPEDFLLVDEPAAAEVDETGAADAQADAANADADADAVAGDADDAAFVDKAGDADAEPHDDLDTDAELDDDLEGAELDDDGDAIAADRDTGPSDELTDELTDDDLKFAERRRGRGGFDPEADARYAETRYARRRRSVGALAVVIAVSVVIGLLVGGWAWWLPLAGVGLMVLYLVYLRRTVIAENELRARRIRRMKMARLGVRNREDEELGVPERLRRPGAVVVELDDEDPEFAGLPYATYETPEEDLRRAAGA